MGLLHLLVETIKVNKPGMNGLDYELFPLKSKLGFKLLKA